MLKFWAVGIDFGEIKSEKLRIESTTSKNGGEERMWSNEAYEIQLSDRNVIK